MSNFLKDIELACNGETPVAVVIGEMGWEDYGLESKHQAASDRRGELLSWDEARSLLDYEYDRGFGAPDCHAIWVWTEHRVVFVSTYDGSTHVCALPRHPITGYTPYMPGGG